MPTSLEINTALLNANVFFREFVFPRTVFTRAKGDEELADNLVCLDDVALAFQMKERGVASGDEAGERTWFKQEVLNVASGQLRKTLDWIGREPELQITNDRGRTVSLGTFSRVVPILLYKNDGLPSDCAAQRHKVSRTTGEFMHILSWPDYELACKVLYTPIEMIDYFAFRQKVLLGSAGKTLRISERALLGQFLAGEDAAPPAEVFASYVDRLVVDLPSFDLRDIVEKFPTRIVTATGDYYPVVSAIAKLDRADLAQFVTRFRLALTAAQEGRAYGPTRMISTREARGFVFTTASPTEDEPTRRILHELYIKLAKHDQRLDKQIGVSFSKSGFAFDILWGVYDEPWTPDPVLDDGLEKIKPFRPLREEPKERYRFELEGQPVG